MRWCKLKAKIYLKKIEKMNAKINGYNEELAYLNALATRTTSALDGDRVQTSGSKDRMADCTVKMADMRNRINEEIDKMIDYKEDAWKLLEQCEPECITLISKKYFQFKSWEEIAVDMNYTYQWVSGGLHQKALEQFQKALDEREE